LKTNISVTLIGSGNVGSQLAQFFHKNGIAIDAVYNKNEESGVSLANTVDSTFISDKTKLPTNSTFYLAALKDDYYLDELKGMDLKNKLIVHTSGSLESQKLNQFSARWGCLYPMQTLTKNHSVNWNKISFLIEAADKKDESFIVNTCDLLELKTSKANSNQRRKNHIAAITTNNFTYHLLSTIKVFCQENNLNFDDLKTLLQKSIENSFQNEAFTMQTGPASRNDLKLVKEHLKLLEDNKNLKEIYELFSKQILKKHHNNEL
jgi:predicted short-subunit dehydrogenase-like oxidoreductase (DUF2520 family)